MLTLLSRGKSIRLVGLHRGTAVYDILLLAETSGCCFSRHMYTYIDIAIYYRLVLGNSYTYVYSKNLVRKFSQPPPATRRPHKRRMRTRTHAACVTITRGYDMRLRIVYIMLSVTEVTARHGPSGVLDRHLHVRPRMFGKY